jgi:hypothetical protein
VISLLGEGETDEPDGIEVRLAVAQDDIEKYREAVRKVAAGFDPVFDCNIDGLHRTNIKERYGSILMTEHAGYQARIRQGCVLYPITDAKKIMTAASLPLRQERAAVVPRLPQVRD